MLNLEKPEDKMNRITAQTDPHIIQGLGHGAKVPEGELLSLGGAWSWYGRVERW